MPPKQKKYGIKEIFLLLLLILLDMHLVTLLSMDMECIMQVICYSHMHVVEMTYLVVIH